jgi:putative tryptophan/tyrosine transport system substrate-binding protein
MNKLLQKFFIIILMINLFSIYLFSEKNSIVIFKSQDIGIYNEVIEGIKDNTILLEKYNVIELNGNNNLNLISTKIEEIKKNIKPKLIITVGAQTSVMVINEIDDIPVIFCGVRNWEKFFVKKNNVTGVDFQPNPNLEIRYMRMTVPEIKNIGIVYNRLYSGEYVENLISAAKKENIKIVGRKIRLSDNEDRNFSNVKRDFNRIKNSIDILYFIFDPVVVTERSFHWLREECLKHEIPLFTYTEQFVKEGALSSLSPNYFNIGSQAGSLAGRILTDNVPPSELDIQTPIGSFFVVNFTIAEYLNLRTDFLRNIVNKIYY